MSNKTKIATQEDLDRNPQLAKDGVKVGDTIFVDENENAADTTNTDTNKKDDKSQSSDGKAVGGQSDPYPNKNLRTASQKAGNQASQQREKEEKHLMQPTTGTKKEVEDLHKEAVQTGSGTQNAHQSNATKNEAAPGETATTTESINKENESKKEEERLNSGTGADLSAEKQSQHGSGHDQSSQEGLTARSRP